MESRRCPVCGRLGYGHAATCSFCKASLEAPKTGTLPLSRTPPPKRPRRRLLVVLIAAASLCALAAIGGAIWAFSEYDEAAQQAEDAYQGVMDNFDDGEPAAASPPTTDQDKAAREAAVKEGIYSLQIAVQTYAVDHGDRYPRPTTGDELLEMLRPYLDTWPTNPYTGKPMGLGKGSDPTDKAAGDFSYGVAEDGSSYTLIGWGPDQRKIITGP
jgi:hypothetical protein